MDLNHQALKYQTLELREELDGSEIEDLQDYQADHQLIKDHSREISLNLRFTSKGHQSADSLASEGPELDKDTVEIINKNKEQLEVIQDIIKSATPESILSLHWDVGRDHTGRWIPFDLFDPETPGYAIHARNLLQTVSTFTNLNTLEYVSHDTSSRFEDEISKTVQLLPHLEILVIARVWIDVQGWDHDDTFEQDDEMEMSKLIGQRLSSLTTLKRLHLQGLVAPRASWGELDWKSPLEYLKVAECSWLFGLAVFPFARAFQKTLLGLTIGCTTPRNMNEVIAPEFDFAKEFEALEELQVLKDLEVTSPQDAPFSPQTFLDEIAQAPKLKHLEIYFDYYDHVLPHINKLIEKSEPVWPSLQTLVAYNNVEDEEREFPQMEEKTIWEAEKEDPFKFGVLNAEWRQHEELSAQDACRYGRLSSSDGRSIEVKVKYEENNWNRSVSLKLGDPSSLQDQDSEDSRDRVDSGYGEEMEDIEDNDD
ncbi:uncharacterized protein MELLADRAFT_69454 [Melampsora larici-populina 98AG31]|uniref:Uncharacterized protein n=1 Tax=Melampsora larici-populina (strain 98AG31 / pathotype 3-4-7) TaxID=747676 RepID=F4SAU2_MELLP|nr:uncharacterized protein MELLADRAFT_69454 [Melampsora larici-populina 98AG31]EGF98224.1 hypothetical protein MELLADRAFT_69454 [Melampsora larici-populina 98AG31]